VTGPSRTGPASLDPRTPRWERALNSFMARFPAASQEPPPDSAGMA
jgi:hypothetical protein